MDDFFHELANRYISYLSQEERSQFFNDLLAVHNVHRLNHHNSYYSLGNSWWHGEKRRRSFQYTNPNGDVLTIYQTYEKRLFKISYHIYVHLNGDSIGYSLVEALLMQLRESCLHVCRNQIAN